MAAAKAAASHLEIDLYRYLGSYHASLLPVPMANIITEVLMPIIPLIFKNFMGNGPG